MNNYIYLFLIFMVFLVFLKLFSNDLIKKKPSFKVRNFFIFYQDSKSDDANVIESRLLYSKKYNLKGKPDYILKHKAFNKYIPIELKSGSIKNALKPHDGDFLQLITYFIIIEEEFGYRPKYGKIMYSDYMFIVRNKPKYRKKLLRVVKEMRTMLKNGQSKKCYPSFNKCKYCICNNTVCEVKK